MKLTIREIKDYVYSHIAEIKSIKDIATYFGTTVDAVRIRWKRSGQEISLGKYISSARISVAESWHKEHPEAICKEIAHHVGHNHYEVASRAFKRLTGRTMRDYFQGR